MKTRLCASSVFRLRPFIAAIVASIGLASPTAADLLAGVAKVDITDREAGPVHDSSYVKALVLGNGSTRAVIITVDAVAIGELGRVTNDYLPTIRKQIQEEFGIPARHVIANASHCHSIVRRDVDQLTIEAVRKASANMVPVRIGTGLGHEDKVMENRRLKLKSGRTVDVRHAYSLPPDDEVADVGPIDPQIGILRLDRADGRTLAVVYNYAGHPIQGVPGGANTADVTGIASQVIEDNLDEGTVALFMQGCGGDINPIFYKDVDHPRSAVPLGNVLALSTLKGLRKIECKPDDRFKVINETIELPRGDRTQRIFQLEARREHLLKSLSGTTLNLKTFLPLVVKYNLADQYPSYYSHRYLHDEAIGRDELRQLDAENRRNLKAYIRNIHAMEELTRVQTNLRLLRRHQADLAESGKRTIDVEVVGVRLGDFVLVTFPGELTVQIGLNLKDRSPHKPTFVAGYTNGYIYYAPTAEQLQNVGNAQEDSDCVLAPEWQAIFEAKALDVLGRL